MVRGAFGQAVARAERPIRAGTATLAARRQERARSWSSLRAAAGRRSRLEPVPERDLVLAQPPAEQRGRRPARREVDQAGVQVLDEPPRAPISSTCRRAWDTGRPRPAARRARRASRRRSPRSAPAARPCSSCARSSALRLDHPLDERADLGERRVRLLGREGALHARKYDRPSWAPVNGFGSPAFAHASRSCGPRRRRGRRRRGRRLALEPRSRSGRRRCSPGSSSSRTAIRSPAAGTTRR